jgi:predicted metal-dependent RNase
MMMPNTISYEIAGSFLQDPRNGIALVGWADPETPGGKIREGNMAQIKSAFQVEKIFCQLDLFHFSAHSNREELIDMITRLDPRTVLLCHGETDSLQWMQARIENISSPPQVQIPKPLEILQL